jgi:hypothetical protein
MSSSPDRYEFCPYSYTPTPHGGRPEGPLSRRPSHLQVPDETPSRTPTPTQYEFIMTTGDESASSAKQKLKTVRSHVMKNYLHQQQQQQRQGRASSSDRRKAKQRTRTSRSTSRESEYSLATTEGGLPGSLGIGALFAGISLTEPFGGQETPSHSSSSESSPCRRDPKPWCFCCPVSDRVTDFFLQVTSSVSL